MKKIIITFGFTCILLGLQVKGFSHCSILYVWEGRCFEQWCVNAGANTDTGCTCDPSVILHCTGPIY